jgi:hypothetical protein
LLHGARGVAELDRPYSQQGSAMRDHPCLCWATLRLYTLRLDHRKEFCRLIIRGSFCCLILQTCLASAVDAQPQMSTAFFLSSKRILVCKRVYNTVTLSVQANALSLALERLAGKTRIIRCTGKRKITGMGGPIRAAR